MKCIQPNFDHNCCGAECVSHLYENKSTERNLADCYEQSHGFILGISSLCLSLLLLLTTVTSRFSLSFIVVSRVIF